MDPDNAQLAADALEVAAALNPEAAADPGSLKQRGDARFKADDMHGAVEAYTALVQLLEQQQQQTAQLAGQEQESEDGSNNEQQKQRQRLLLAALSNRAACWLSLEKYEACVADCLTALHLALPETAAGGMCSSSTASDTAKSSTVVNTGHAAPGKCQGALETADMLSWVLLHPLVQPQQLLAVKGAACARSVARLLGRAAVAYSCLKQLQPAEELYGLAENFWHSLGFIQRAAALSVDRQKLQQLSAESGH